MSKNYYVILGVAADASGEDIKSAYRRRARELHPDTSGLACAPFQELQEAFSVLVDPQRRREYDRKREVAAPASTFRGHEVRAVQPTRPPAEPLRAPARAASLLRDFDRYGPSFEAIRDRFWRNFEPTPRPKSEHAEPLTVEVVLTPEEARYGGRVRLWVPSKMACGPCRGLGAVGPYICRRCEGQGSITAEKSLELQYPPGIRDLSAIRLPLANLGVHNLHLVALFRVAH
jgi:DnaJ-class molecular chaperone